MDRTRKVAILVFDNVEVLDFAGPFEVFSVANRVAVRDGDPPPLPFDVFLCASGTGPIRARHGLSVTPRYSLSDSPDPDVLIIPGGVVTQPLHDKATMDWISQAHATAEVTASVCTGAFLLNCAGLLTGIAATTHWEDIPDLRIAAPDTMIVEGVAYVDEGRIVTSGGVSSGITMSLHLVSRLTTPDLARRTARQMEYPLEG